MLFDRHRNQVFTGDFVYRHLGGIIAFASGSDLTAYKENSTRLLQLTNTETQFFGAHGIPRFHRDWLTLLDRELEKIIKGTATSRYAAHYLAPGIPWRVYQNGGLYIYTTPLVDPPVFLVEMDGVTRRDHRFSAAVPPCIAESCRLVPKRQTPWLCNWIRLFPLVDRSTNIGRCFYCLTMIWTKILSVWRMARLVSIPRCRRKGNEWISVDPLYSFSTGEIEQRFWPPSRTGSFSRSRIRLMIGSGRSIGHLSSCVSGVCRPSRDSSRTMNEEKQTVVTSSMSFVDLPRRTI